MGLKSNNRKESLYLLSIFYIVISFLYASSVFLVPKFMQKGFTDLDIGIVTIEIFFSYIILLIVTLFIVIYIHTKSISNGKKLNFFPRVKYFKEIVLILTIIFILSQLYDPLVLNIAKSSFNADMCHKTQFPNALRAFFPGFLFFYPEKNTEVECVMTIAKLKNDPLICNKLNSSIYPYTAFTLKRQCLEKLTYHYNNGQKVYPIIEDPNKKYTITKEEAEAESKATNIRIYP